ncbi:MAG: 16S rRNA (guanine(527)-N(7))-methyltransferase RsmG, partial [Planctomycetota bacterium]
MTRPRVTESSSLSEALKRYGIDLPTPQVELLERYCAVLWEWNGKMNLTRHTTYDRFVARDIVDTLAFARHLEPKERVLDVGSGGGVPGITLAIVRPDIKVALSESVAKKAGALADMVDRLELPIRVFTARAEEALRIEQFNTLTVRAVAPLSKLLRWFRPMWHTFDRLLLVKGPSWVEERGQARHFGLLRNLALRRLEEYTVPETEAASVVLQICPADRMIDKRRCRLEDRSPKRSKNRKRPNPQAETATNR